MILNVWIVWTWTLWRKQNSMESSLLGGSVGRLHACACHDANEVAFLAHKRMQE